MGGECYRSGVLLIRCGRASDGANFDWPIVRVYRLSRNRWVGRSTVQDETMRYAIAPHFRRSRGRIDPTTVVGLLLRQTQYVGQSIHPCQLVDQVCTISGYNIVHVSSRPLRTPIAELDRLAGLVQAGKRRAFGLAVPKPWRAKLCDLLMHDARVYSATAGGDKSRSADLSLYYPDADYVGPHLNVHFAKKNGRWRLVRVEKAAK
jgi:hypothetical protein